MVKWTRDTEFGAGSYRLGFLLWIYRFFGRTALKIAVIPIAFAAFLFRRGVRRASLDYFARLYAFSGRPELKPSLLNTFRHLYSFAGSLVDKLSAWAGDITEDQVEYNNKEAVARFFENLRMKKGIFILCSHLGNIEIMRAMAVGREEKIKVNAFVETGRTQEFNTFIAKMNPDAAMNLFPIKDIGIETAVLFKTKLEEGEVAVMAADREPALNEKSGAILPFLGGKALFPVGVFRFLKLMECDFCFLFICRNDNGKFDVHIDFLDAEVSRRHDEVMKTFVARLETLVLQYPWQWYNFYSFWL